MTTAVRFLILFLIVTGVFVDPALSAGKKRVVLKPKQAGQEIAIVVSGKIRSYHSLSATQPSIIEVKGPGELHILTRAVLDTTTNVVGYSLVYAVDGDAQQTFDVEGVERAPNAVYKEAGMGIPADVEELRLKIGRGTHRVAITLRDSLPGVSARYLFAPRRQKKIKWVAMTPLAPVEPVDLYAGEQTIHCYRFSNDKPLRISIIGPTELRILTRLENSFTMKGRINYRIQIRQSGRVVQTFQLSSRRSETTLYRDNTKLVPGRVREIVFTVPKGMQHYEIVPLDKHTVLGQILFPQKDAKLEL